MDEETDLKSLKRARTVFVCPFMNTLDCPKVKLFSDDSPYVRTLDQACNRSPIVRVDDGSSICMLKMDMLNPMINNTIRTLGNLIEFRKER